MPKRPKKRFPGGVVRCVFDNEQVIGKRYSVKAAKSAAPVSVITSHAYLLIDPESNFQTIEAMKPSSWMFEDMKDEQIYSLKNVTAEMSTYLRETRNTFISESLKVLKTSQRYEDSTCRDKIDNLVAEKKHVKTRKSAKIVGQQMTLLTGFVQTARGGLKKGKFTIPSTFETAPVNIKSPYNHFKWHQKRIKHLLPLVSLIWSILLDLKAYQPFSKIMGEELVLRTILQRVKEPGYIWKTMGEFTQ